APAGGVDLRLALAGEVDGLRVASPFEVEDAARAPAVLIIPDQVSFGVGGKRGLPGARQAEEDGDVAGLPQVGGAVHGEGLVPGEQVVHYREDGLLDLAGVARAADEDLGAGEVQDDEGAGAGAMAFGL